MHHMVFSVPSLCKGMMQIHEQFVFMDQSALAYVLILTRTRVTVNVKPPRYTCGDTVAVHRQFLCSLFQSFTRCVCVHFL